MHQFCLLLILRSVLLESMGDDYMQCRELYFIYADIHICHCSPSIAFSSVQPLPLETDSPASLDDSPVSLYGSPVSVVESLGPVVCFASPLMQYDHSSPVLVTALPVAVFQCAGSWRESAAHVTQSADFAPSLSALAPICPCDIRHHQSPSWPAPVAAPPDGLRADPLGSSQGTA